MNYGFDSNTEGWQEDKKIELAEKIEEIVTSREYRVDEGSPYVEVDGLYGGVRVRKITNLTTENRENLVHKVEKVYKEVMDI